MYARSTTLRGRPEAISAGIALVRDEVMPSVQAMDGCVGLSMLVDRDTGGAIVTTAWQDEPTLRESELQTAALRDRAQQVFGARPEVRSWEIAVLHRVRATDVGACARVTWTLVEPDLLERQLEIFRHQALARVEDLDGFCSASLLVDRQTGRGVLATTYESADALRRTRAAASDLRGDFAQRMASQVLDVAEFEVALAHLRVPETV